MSELWNERTNVRRSNGLLFIFSDNASQEPSVAAAAPLLPVNVQAASDNENVSERFGGAEGNAQLKRRRSADGSSNER